MSWIPHVTVAALIRQADRYLMVEEAPDGQAVLNQPAGHLERDETLVEAVTREVLEETGRRFLPTGLVGIYQWSVPGGDRAYLRFCFAGEVSPPEKEQRLDPDIITTHWLTRDQIANGRQPPRSPLVLRCIDDAAQRPLIELDLLTAVPSAGL